MCSEVLAGSEVTAWLLLCSLFKHSVPCHPPGFCQMHDDTITYYNPLATTHTNDKGETYRISLKPESLLTAT